MNFSKTLIYTTILHSTNLSIKFHLATYLIYIQMNTLKKLLVIYSLIYLTASEKERSDNYIEQTLNNKFSSAITGSYTDLLDSFNNLGRLFRKWKKRDSRRILSRKANIDKEKNKHEYKGFKYKENKLYQDIPEILGETELGRRVERIFVERHNPANTPDIYQKVGQGEYHPVFNKYFVMGETTKANIYREKILNEIVNYNNIRRLAEEEVENEGEEQLECSNGGKLLKLTLNQYICNGQTVPKNIYESMTPIAQINNCSVLNKGKTYMCVCHKDFYGQTCSVQERTICNVIFVTPSDEEFDCGIIKLGGENNENVKGNAKEESKKRGLDIEFYDFGRFGLPPCIFLDFNTIWDVTLKLQCKLNPGAEEAIETGSVLKINETNYVYNITEYNEIVNNFTYAIKNTDISLTYEPNHELNFAFMNFNKFTEMDIEAVKLSNSQISGASFIKLHIDLGKLRKELKIGGRAYFTVYVSAIGGSDEYFNQNIYTVLTNWVIDERDYDEPVADRRLAWWAILLIVLGVILFVGLTIAFIIYCYKRRVANKKFMAG